MPIALNWYDDERTILIATFTDPWAWEGYFTAQTEVTAMIDEVDHMVHTIADFTDSNTVPRQSILALPRIASLTHERQTMTAVGHAGRMGEMAASIFNKVYVRINYAPTLEDAIAAIRQHQSE